MSDERRSEIDVPYVWAYNNSMSDDNEIPRCGDENAEPLFGSPNVWCSLPRGHDGPHLWTWVVETRPADEKETDAKGEQIG